MARFVIHWKNVKCYWPKVPPYWIYGKFPLGIGGKRVFQICAAHPTNKHHFNCFNFILQILYWLNGNASRGINNLIAAVTWCFQPPISFKRRLHRKTTTLHIRRTWTRWAGKVIPSRNLMSIKSRISAYSRTAHALDLAIAPIVYSCRKTNNS